MREGMAGSAVAAFDAAIDGLLAVDLDGLSDDSLLRFVADVEQVVRRVSVVQDAVTAAVDSRGLAHGRGCSTTAALLRQLLRLSSTEAKARVRAADRFAQRRAMSGEVLAPLLPAVAAARAAGEISPKQAADIAAAVDALPAHVDEAGKVAEIETFLVEQARVLTPEELSVVTRRLLATLDPDGTLAEVDYRDRRRDLTLHQRPDGSVTGRFEGTAEFGELLLTILDVTSAPTPSTEGSTEGSTNGVPDTRTARQRRHDGLLAAFRLILRTGQLPTAHGVLATIVLTTTSEQWATNHGLARTGHGALIPVPEAKAIARGDARQLTLTLDKHGGITGWTDTRRFFTENQRLAMATRDGGCTFPGCDVPAAWCDADHIVDHAQGGPTSIDNGHLACGFHHRAKNRTGWTVTMIDQQPHWTAPPWLDPSRTPRRNHTHDPVGVG